MRASRLIATFGALVGALALASPASAAESATMHVSLSPEHLGKGTTVVFEFDIHDKRAQVPPALTGIELLYPKHVGLASSGLGLEECSATTLEAAGSAGCPTDALVGRGSAQVEIAVGGQLVRETGAITVWMAAPNEGHLALVFFTHGQAPVDAELIFAGDVIEGAMPFGGNLRTQIPIIPSLPEAPDAAVVHMRETIGPLGITYYRQAHGKRVAYRPRGLRLPRHCPHGGFPFGARFTFADRSQARASTTVACPAKR
jgi:hypothetical protein